MRKIASNLHVRLFERLRTLKQQVFHDVSIDARNGDFVRYLTHFVTPSLRGVGGPSKMTNVSVIQPSGLRKCFNYQQIYHEMN